MEERGRSQCLLQVLTAVLVLCGRANGISEAVLLPFGMGPPELTLPSGNIVFETFDISTADSGTLQVNGNEVQEIQVSNDGRIRLDQNSSGILDVFAADVDTRAAGTVFYGLRNDSGVLEQYVAAAAAIDSRFAGCYDRVFTVTWDSVGYFDQKDNPLNTFQGHILYNSAGIETLVIYLYPPNGINWTTGDGDGGTNGLGGTPARVGLDFTVESLFLPESGTAAIINIESLSNIGIPGVFVFRADTNILEPDASFGGTDVVCDDGEFLPSSSASGSGVGGSGSGAPGMPGCVSAGFSGCCVPTANESCVVNSGQVDECSCDVGCFENDTCCFDITAVPCLPDIFVEFLPQNYTVTEGTDDYVNITVRATGFPDPSFDVDDVTVLLMTEDGTAEGGEDFQGVIRELRFSSDGEWVVMIPILDNSPVELTEFFTARLATDNPFIIFNNNVSTVEIIDNDFLFVSLDQPLATPEANGTAEVCVSVESGVLQTGLQVVLTLDTIATDPQDAADFGAGPFMLNFTSGDTIQCENVPIRIDDLIEGNETFSIHILDEEPSSIVRVVHRYRDIVILDSTVGFISSEPPQPVVETAGAAEVCAVIGGAQLERDVVARIETAPSPTQSAIDPDDYIGGVFLLTFEQPSTRECVNISIVPDSIFEDDETFLVSVASDDPAIEPGILTTALCIILDETDIPFDFANDLFGLYLVQESDAVATVCVAVVGMLDREVVLSLATSDATALAGADYNATTVQLTFNATTTQNCVEIGLTQDLVVENPEVFRVNLSSADPEVVFVRDQATVSITDSTRVEIGFVPVDYTVRESDSFVEVCVAETSTPPVQFMRNVSLMLSTSNGLATAPVDFVPVTGNVIFFPSTSCINVTINNDGLIEPDEFFTVGLSSMDPAVMLGNDVATVNIVNDDVVAPIGIELPFYSVGEADGFVEVCVVAIGQLTQDVQFFLLSQDVSTTSGTGGNNDDFEAVSERLTLMAGANPRVCVNVTINDDTADEIDEGFIIDLTPLTPWPIFRNTTDVVIVDDDEVQIAFSPQSYTVREGVNDMVMVCVSLDRLLQRDGVVVQISTSDGTAQSGMDYNSSNQTLVFNTGVQQRCVDIDINDDMDIELTEVFSVNLLSVTGEGILNSPAQVTILDNDEVFEFDFVTTNPLPLPLFFEQENRGSATVCVRATATLSREVVVTLATSDFTAINPGDYTSTTVQLTFNQTASELCADIPLQEDSIVENPERFRVSLSSSDQAVRFVRTEAEVVIIDATTFQLGFVPVNYTVRESDGSVQVCVDQTSSPPVQFVRDVPISFSTADGSATTQMDYQQVNNFIVLFLSTSCINVTINDDGMNEPDEFFTVGLSSMDPAVMLSNDVATVNIVNDDVVAPIGIELPFYSVGEADGFVEVCVVAIGQLTQDVQVSLLSQDVSTTSGTGGNNDDFEAVSESLTLMAGANPRVCVNVTINDDTADEIDEGFIIDLTPLTPWPIFRNTTDVGIFDDDEVRVGFSPQEYTVTEGVNSVARVCVSLDRPLQRNGVSVQIATADQSALNGLDYTALTRTLVFNSGDQQMCADVAIMDDDLVEQPETFLVNLQSLSGDPLSNSQAVVTILSNDARATLSFEQLSYAVTETDSTQVTSVCVIADTPVTRNGVVASVFSFEFTGEATVGVDFLRVQEMVTFNVGDPRQCIDVTILGDDAIEGTERFPLELFSDDADIGQSSAIVTINDDDIPDPPMFGFENPGALSFPESAGTVPVCVVVVSGTVTQNTAVTVTSAQAGDTAQEDVDYNRVMETLMFTAGSTRMCVDLVIIDDEIGENSETLTLSLSSGPQATVTILNNDPVLLLFNDDTYTVNEGDDLTVFVVANRIFVNGPFPATVRSQDDTATSIGASPDFDAINQNILFSTTVSVTINTNSDLLIEGNEQFTLTLSNTGRVLSTATVTIIDRPPGAPVFGFENPGALSFPESAGTIPVCVVVVSGTVSQNTAVTVTSAQAGDTAQENVDYNRVMETLVFTAGGSTRMCVDLVIIDDEIGENSETLTLSLSSGPQATVTILDNDPVLLLFNDDTYTVNEGDDLTVFVVANRIFVNGPFPATVRSQDDTATSIGASPDFDAINQNILFSTTVPVTINTNSDLSIEGNEQFTLTLSNTGGGILSIATVTIIDANVMVGARVGLEVSAYVVREEEEAVRVCASLTEAVSTPVSATISTFDISAFAGVDYTALSTVLTFSGDDLRECVEIDLVNDDIGEQQESFGVSLVSTLPVFRDQSVVNILQDQDGRLVVTLQEPIMAVDEGRGVIPVCVDFVGSNLGRQAIVTLTTTETGGAIEDVDYLRESTEVTYFPSIVEVIICENVTITNDLLEEEIEIFGVTLTTADPAVSFVVSSGVIIIVDNDNPNLSAGFVQTDIRELETDGLSSARLRAFVNGRITQSVDLSISIVGGTATVREDFLDAGAVLRFNANSDNPQRDFYTILGDSVLEMDETILFQLSAPGGVTLIGNRASAEVTILNDDGIPAESGVIVLMEDTPQVTVEGGAGRVRVAFSLSADAASAECALRDLIFRQDCSSGEFIVTGLPADISTSLRLEITARNQLGQQVAFLSRAVRLGLNDDCAVNFLNGVEEAQVFQGLVFIEFSPVGPVTSTECQLDGGDFTPCESPVQFDGLELGEHRVKVRPNGDSCRRTIRRTVEFTVV